MDIRLLYFATLVSRDELQGAHVDACQYDNIL